MSRYQLAVQPQAFGGVVLWEDFLRWLDVNRIGDITGLFGVVISICGFILTLLKLVKTQKIAAQAAQAAQEARENVRTIDAVVDFSFAITYLEEIKRAHRDNKWILLPDRYSQIRKVLISINKNKSKITDNQRAIVTRAISDLKGIENAVEKFLVSETSIDVSRLNRKIAYNIDELYSVLHDIKSNGAES